MANLSIINIEKTHVGPKDETNPGPTSEKSHTEPAPAEPVVKEPVQEVEVEVEVVEAGATQVAVNASACAENELKKSR